MYLDLFLCLVLCVISNLAIISPRRRDQERACVALLNCILACVCLCLCPCVCACVKAIIVQHGVCRLSPLFIMNIVLILVLRSFRNN